ncbi:uncharacterized protein LOC143198716 [Rhynchophorus ferrugineus]|uniref:uncharacterized protein LOC143198716 n=1 Tax=Rhynchophorus ferrugineus TaxID=354439 RepID=UPI003FCD7984
MTQYTVFLIFSTSFLIMMNCLPHPGSKYHHVHHRIHVPQKIKTVYHTKIIKVPEHHHHFHEKEKIIIEKQEPKEEHHHHHSLSLKDEEDYDFSGLESTNVYNKKRNVRPPPRASKTKFKKRRVFHRSVKGSY